MESASFTTFRELIDTTNPAIGDYVVELYGNTYIHQNPQSGSITAYQQDRSGRIHLVEHICQGMQLVSQLSVSADGRHFAFIALNRAHGDIQGDAFVYFLDTIDKTMECAFSWPIDSDKLQSMVFFSLDGKYALFSDGQTRLEVQSLYTSDPVWVFLNLYLGDTAQVNDGTTSIIPLFIRGSDYVLWRMTSGSLAMIDLLADGQVSHSMLTPSIKLADPFVECWLHNDYLIHVNHGVHQVDIYRVNPLEHTMSQVESIPLHTCGPVACTNGPDSSSVILHYLDSAQYTTSQLIKLGY